METKYEIAVIGSGFGGSIAARRLAEAGRNVVMLERGPWRDTTPNQSVGIENLAPLPQGVKMFTHGLRSIGAHFLKREVVLNRKGFAEAYFGDGINVICSSNVGGGSHIFAGILGGPASSSYWDDRHPEISQKTMGKYYDEILDLLQARPITREDKIPNLIEQTDYQGELSSLGAEWVLPIGILLPAKPGQPAKVKDRHGVERWECDMRNNSFLGSPSGAKTTLDFSFIWPAMQSGLIVRDLCEASSIRKLRTDNAEGMRYEILCRNHREGREERVLAKHVILAAGCLNTMRLLLRSRDVEHGLDGMPRLGLKFGGNGDFFGFWKEGGPRDLSAGLPINGPFRLKNSNNKTVLVLRSGLQGLDDVPMPSFARKWLQKQSVIIAFGGDGNTGSIALERGVFKIRYKTSENDIYREIDSEIKGIEAATDTKVYAPGSPFTVHPIGGACLGTSNADGVVGPNGEVFDNCGLYVADAAALPESPGGPPSLTIAAWSANVADRLLASLLQPIDLPQTNS